MLLVGGGNMKILFKNESEFKERIAEFNADKHYDRHYLSMTPESYPCIGVFNSDTSYLGDFTIETIEFIYPSDFPWSHL
jgi:hypothetical protein